ncbi:MAG TPA: DUF2189 domain-containing protein [Paracoccus sp. (in: a-proteobacteria)]|uniref:DUF2189 domain-containing protein n=1 Tax=uncultured Paracoccus sp. TaxID=189685 RepID=UPI00261835E9|nr:DUF2189 domain-containing protein [uncultured Paracoccus sp.]HMQ39886.1 DUF2189 domain-containing protein [Paracoccus sp. (in: a-proteobacteria)]HMR35204.1 DUF2189 domain-containing protein [Paracoccus sp. (in: a-proteobacteria)]
MTQGNHDLEIEHREPDVIPEPAHIGMEAIGTSLRAGWRDFLRAPGYGLFFAAFYVAGGLVLAAVAALSGQEWWLMPFVVGFPLIAPFAAVGLYEVSRRLESGQPLIWRDVMNVVFSQKDRQLPSMAMVILLLFMFWVFVAHTTFALFMGVSALTNITSSMDALMQGRGLAMLLFGTLIGAGFAAVLFSFTVVGLPLLMDREVDFISAIIASIRAVAANPVVLAVWGVLIAVILFLGILPLFLGLFVALPVLGHSSWHMYRQLMPDEPEA